jgi:hypothetical protein
MQAIRFHGRGGQGPVDGDWNTLPRKANQL